MSTIVFSALQPGFFCGVDGIRTTWHGRFQWPALPWEESNLPPELLHHIIAEDVGFEPTIPFSILVFKTSAFGRSANLPVFVRPIGFEPMTVCLDIPTTTFVAIIRCLWSGLSLYHIITDLGIHRQVSTRSFIIEGFARDYHFTGFPEFDEIHYKVSLITPPYLRQMLYPAELRAHTFNSSRGGNRTRTNITVHQIFVPTTTFVAIIWCLWSGLSLNPRLYVRVPPVKSLHVPFRASLGIAILQVSPNLRGSTSKISLRALKLV